jgi:hypothetical protein
VVVHEEIVKLWKSLWEIWMSYTGRDQEDGIKGRCGGADFESFQYHGCPNLEEIKRIELKEDAEEKVLKASYELKEMLKKN